MDTGTGKQIATTTPGVPDWFERLPEAEQQRLIRRWEQKESHGEVHGERDRTRLRTALIHGAIVLPVAIVVSSLWTGAFMTTLWRVVVAAVTGAAAGAAMHKTHSGRFGSAAIGMSGWLTVQLMTGGFAVGGVIPLALLFSGLVLATCLFAALGVSREFGSSI